MKTSRLFRLMYACILLCQNNSAQVTDSIFRNELQQEKKFLIGGFVATSFFVNKNWKEINNSSFTFSGSLNIVCRKNSDGLKRVHELRSELSYLKYIDSVWVKNTDNIFLSSIWTFNGNRQLKNALSVNLKTQMTDTWDDRGNNQTEKTWKSGPMLPAAFIAGYGLNWGFWKKSYLNVSFAAIKILSKPRNDDIIDDKKIVAKTDRIIFNSEYGFNLQSSIEKNDCEKCYLGK